MDEILEIIKASLSSIANPRFYETERGFQGELVGELRNRLPEIELEKTIVEQEYQKRIKDHGFKIRPDIIIHIPFKNSHFTSRREGNFVVIELKHRATENEALADYERLSSMCDVLGYPLGVFINIDSDETYIGKFQGPHMERLRSFSVHLENSQVILAEEYAT
jgi:hypothetical protein